jgi:hypothetical protein
MEHPFIFAAGWIFFALWGMALAAISVIAFRRDISSLLPNSMIRKNRT